MTFLMVKGSHSYEVQIGTLVFQLRRPGRDAMGLGFEYEPKLVNVFRDPFGSWLPKRWRRRG